MTSRTQQLASQRVAGALIVIVSLVTLAATSGIALAYRAAAAHSARSAATPVAPPNVTLHYHATVAANSGNPGFIATDAAGNLYVSDLAAKYVYMYDASGTYVRSFGTGVAGSGDGQFGTPEGIAVSGSSVYVTDNGNDRIQVFNRDTGAYLNQFTAGLLNPFGITVGANGNLYVADSANSRIVEFTPAGSYVMAFGTLGSGNGQFNQPLDVAASSNGYLLVTDTLNNRVQELTLSGGYVTQWGATSLNHPSGIAVDRANMVYVADEFHSVIRKYDLRGVPTGSFGASGATPARPAATGPTYNYPPGQLVGPEGIAVTNVRGTQPAIYVSDLNRAQVYRFDSVLQPTLHTSIAHFGSTGTGNGQFIGPWGMAVDSHHNLYITDAKNNRVQKFDQFGNFVLAWGSTGSGNGQFSFPEGITIDDADEVYVVDTRNNRVEVFNTNGSYLRQWGTGGSGNGQFSIPQGIAFDGTSLYVVDTGDDRVEKFDTTGAYVGQWGSFGTGNGQFYQPVGIAVDRAPGEVFVTDYSNDRVETFSENGDYFSSWQLATGDQPQAIATDQRGSVYVVDSYNNDVLQYDDYGTYEAAFGSFGSGAGQFGNPYSIIIDPKSSQIWVSDWFYNTVQRFGSPDGESDTVGIWRPSSRTFFLKYANTTGNANLSVLIPYAQSTDIPVVGDWNGDGVDGLGVYRSSNGTFYLQDALGRQASPDYVVTLGHAGDTPIIGDWNGSGHDELGIFRPSNGVIYLKYQLTTGFADVSMVLGLPGDKGLAGDWNGDGQDSPGVYRPSNQHFLLSDKVVNGTVVADHAAVLGIAGDAPFTGDWISQGSKGIGVFRVSNGVTFLKNQPTSGFANTSFVVGIGNDVPVAGVWRSPGVPSSAPH